MRCYIETTPVEIEVLLDPGGVAELYLDFLFEKDFVEYHLSSDPVRYLYVPTSIEVTTTDKGIKLFFSALGVPAARGTETYALWGLRSNDEAQKIAEIIVNIEPSLFTRYHYLES